MCPVCAWPSRLPAPRISRSRIAILNPEPRSVNSPIVFNRSYACSLRERSGGYNRYAYARLRYEALDVFGHVRDVVHAVVHVEDLTFAQQLSPDCFRHGAFVELADV